MSPRHIDTIMVVEAKTMRPSSGPSGRTMKAIDAKPMAGADWLRDKRFLNLRRGRLGAGH